MERGLLCIIFGGAAELLSHSHVMRAKVSIIFRRVGGLNIFVIHYRCDTVQFYTEH